MGAILRKGPNTGGTLVVLLLLVFVGCTVIHELGRDGDSPPRFSHLKHGEALGLKCESCHSSFKDSDAAGMPTLAGCEVCHKDDGRYAEYMDAYVQDGRAVWRKAENYSEDVIFSHQRHYGAGVECAACHKGVARSDAISAESRPTKDDCLRCHGKAGLSSDCSLCHREIRRDFEPRSHRQNWALHHGQIARSGQDRPSVNRCKLCHADSFCAACHQVTPPRDHTNHFRRRWHGISAGMDRRRCETCHRTDFCTRCHEHTSPMSHSGAWASPRNGHCVRCHFPLPGQSCFVCHKTDSSHRAKAASLPDDPAHRATEAEQCRACHAADIPHPDPGEDCRRCHG